MGRERKVAPLHRKELPLKRWNGEIPDAGKFMAALAKLGIRPRRSYSEWDVMCHAYSVCVAMGINPNSCDLGAIGRAMEIAGQRARRQHAAEGRAIATKDRQAEARQTRDTSKGGRISDPVRARASVLVQAEARFLRRQADLPISVHASFNLAVQNVAKKIKKQLTPTATKSRHSLNKRLLAAIGISEAAQSKFANAERVKYIRHRDGFKSIARKAVAPESRRSA